MTTHYDVIVAGEGFAGLSCAQEAAKLGLKVATFEAEFFGGLVLNVNELQCFEEVKGFSGMDAAAMMAKANANAGVKSVNVAVTSIRKVGDSFEVEAGGTTYNARAVVIASGARLKKLGVAGEEEFEGRGVSHCADCDAPMFTGAAVVVVGANDWAIHEARVLAADAAEVYLIHEGKELRASQQSIDQLRAESKIEIIADCAIDAILGNDRGVTSVCLRNTSGMREVECSGVFPFIGLVPNSEMAPPEIARDSDGALEVNSALETGIVNLFAIGNVRAGFPGWLNDAVSDGRRAAQELASRLK